MNIFLISIFEAIYIIYMLNYFKTTYNFAHPLTYFENRLLYHPIEKSNVPISPVCPLGNISAWFYAFIFIVRNCFVNTNFEKTVFKINKYLIILLFIGSFLNFNVVIYLLPIFIIEYFLFKNYN